jgi:hypothetical protein
LIILKPRQTFYLDRPNSEPVSGHPDDTAGKTAMPAQKIRKKFYNH